MSGGGDCYPAAFNLALENRDCGLTLVHGRVWGQGALKGRRFGHAWTEDEDGMVLDHSNGKELALPREDYYALGGIDNTARYELTEAIAAALESEHYGPWHDDGTEL